MRSRNALFVLIAAASFFSSAVGEATEPSGIESNVLLAQGRTVRPLKDRVGIRDGFEATFTAKSFELPRS